MKDEQEVREKIDDLESERDDLEGAYGETLEDEGIEEGSDRGEDMRLEYDEKVEAIEKQIELLEWVLGE